MTHVLIVSGNFYPEISKTLIEGAKRALTKAKATFDIVEVPGAFEIPAAIRFAIESEEYDGYVALGCVIRGETTHYDYVCAESARGLMGLGLAHNAAIGYGILTVENMDQAHIRAALDDGDKGGCAVEACLSLIKIKQQMGA